MAQAEWCEACGGAAACLWTRGQGEGVRYIGGLRACAACGSQAAPMMTSPPQRPSTEPQTPIPAGLLECRRGPRRGCWAARSTAAGAPEPGGPLLEDGAGEYCMRVPHGTARGGCCQELLNQLISDPTEVREQYTYCCCPVTRPPFPAPNLLSPAFLFLTPASHPPASQLQPRIRPNPVPVLLSPLLPALPWPLTPPLSCNRASAQSAAVTSRRCCWWAAPHACPRSAASSAT